MIEIISRGEDSGHQFKANMTNDLSLGQELVALSNSGGGEIYIGVSDDGTIAELTREDMGRLNQLISNAASQQVRPPINPQSENIGMPDGLVMRVVVQDGISKPYTDKNGVTWVKSGSDKRKATSREEIQRLYQQAGLVHADEVPVRGMTIGDIDLDYFREFYESNYGEPLKDSSVALPDLLKNMNLLQGDEVNISGALLFGKKPNFRLPAFIVKAAAFPGLEFHEDSYLDNKDISGKIADVFQQSMSFVLGNIKHVQEDQGVNTAGTPEVPRIALEELIANALIHRDYFISAPVRILVFDNRIEIISPGHLPNNLTVENIKKGNSNIRNPILASFASKILPYRGLGSGIIRALKAYPDIDFDNDLNGNLFKALIRRKT